MKRQKQDLKWKYGTGMSWAKKTKNWRFGLQSPSGAPLTLMRLYLVQVDSYGHYFRVLKTKVQAASLDPTWNEEFMVDLEGSENLRLLVYQVQ